MTGGLSEALLRLTGSLGRHAAALAALARLEAGEAAAQTLKVAAYLVVGGVALLLGYVFLLLAVAFLLAAVFKVGWPWIALGFAVLHGIVVAVCAWNARELLRRPWFPATGAEVRRNFELLGSPAAPVGGTGNEARTASESAGNPV